jgi:hypothetical protein
MPIRRASFLAERGVAIAGRAVARAVVVVSWRNCRRCMGVAWERRCEFDVVIYVLHLMRGLIRGICEIWGNHRESLLLPNSGSP